MERKNIKCERILYVYLDESGDLGFSGGGSKYFTIAFLLTENPIEIKRVVRKVKQKYKIPINVELKANTTRKKIRIDLLNRLSKLEIEIQSITVKKKNVDTKLRKDPNILYNYMVGLSLVEKIARLEPQIIKAIIIVDKRTISVEYGFKLNEYLKYKVWYEKEKKDIDLEIHHFESHNVYGLQAIDIIANTIFKKYNSSNIELFNIIKNRISYDKILFFD